MNKLNDKVTLITGASSGIGEACAKQFAQAGAKLILAARRLDKLNDLATSLKKQFDTKVHCLELDIAKRTQVIEKLANLPEDFKNIDILVNNAGLAVGRDAFQETSFDGIDAMIDTNVKGLAYMTRAIVPDMIKRNQGHIINIGSIAGHETYPGGAIYCATKHAVNAISKALYMDILGSKVRISSIDPGMVETNFSVVRFNGDKKAADAVYADMTPLTPDDIADNVLYVATRPAHVNIRELVVFPVDQASATMIHKV